MNTPKHLEPSDSFAPRHLGPGPSDLAPMLERVGASSLEQLIEETVPAGIRMNGELDLPPARSEHTAIGVLAEMIEENQVHHSCIGMGYSGTITPPVVLRNVLENPSWYTQYTPYQAEISQGRLEALLVYQTMVADLCGLELANASLLDEGTAAAEAMALCWASGRRKRSRFVVSDRCHPQSIAVIQTRAQAIGIVIDVTDLASADLSDACGVLAQYPDTYGKAEGLEPLVARAHEAGALVVVATDLLALTLLQSPGDAGADVAIGTSQRFGVPMGNGGPHAAFFATSDKYKRLIPGRIIGISKDAHGGRALRMALQTREQHIRRDKATSNVCTAQVLLAIMAAMYGVWHGPDGLRRIAQRVRGLTLSLRAALGAAGLSTGSDEVFDTLRVDVGKGRASEIHAAARKAGFNLREIDGDSVGVSLDETTTVAHVRAILQALVGSDGDLDAHLEAAPEDYPKGLQRTSEYLTHEVFSSYHAEHEMLRWIHRLAAKDLSLSTSMIPLGSCTMKLNATSEMLPVTWSKVCNIHPFAPQDQTKGYAHMLSDLEKWLAEITGFAATSLQPNAGSQGELSGMLVIRAYHKSRGEGQRDVCLIPTSAHGTNPASAVMAGMKVVAVACDDAGNIDVADLRAKAEKHAPQLAALMVTYPSTHGVFEESIAVICDAVHENGGQVYMDGANMNAQVGLCRPGDFGPDVCHLNLHKTFAIPHGGGGPGMGPICVGAHLADFLPNHPLAENVGGRNSCGTISAAPYGSAAVLPITWMYIAMLGPQGVRQCSEIAILSANYMAARLKDHYPVLFTGAKGRVAHEFIIDLRGIEKDAGVSGEDVAKRLMDYGFHAPTMSFPVTGTLMIEPTESESRAELDRFCEALISIRGEITQVQAGTWPADNNPLCNAPHTAVCVMGDDWQYPYSRELAAYPAAWTRDHKYWPTVSRIDNGFGDRNLICSCPPMEELAAPETDTACGLESSSC